METEYRNHSIRFNENKDEWSCYDIKYGNSSLRKVKMRIDKMYLDMRKKSSIIGFEYFDGNPPSLIESVAISYNENPPTYFKGQHVISCIAHRPGYEKKSRREISLSDFIADTPDTARLMKIVIDARRAVRDAEAVHLAALKALPRVSVEDIAGLIEASNAKIEE